MTQAIEIVEVGPRDGLQNEKALLEVADKLDFIRRLEACGARRIEAVSFVNERRVPQMAGAEEIMAALPHEDGRSRIGLVLNERGWDRALAAGCRRGQRRGLRHRRLRHPQPGRAGGRADGGHGPHRRAARARGRAADHRHHLGRVRLPVRWRGHRGPGRGPRRARPARAGVGEIALGDTIGVADPWTVRRRIEAVRKAAPDARMRMHFHDTRNTGLANAYRLGRGGRRRCSTPAAAASAAARSRPTPPATSPPRTWSTCWSAAASRPATILDGLIETGRWIGEKIGKPVPRR